jgi:cation diffusion facilitator family transporter
VLPAREPHHPSMAVVSSNTGQSNRTVALALAANLGTAVAKLIAALGTRSGALLAEAIHAFADSGNEVLLLVAERSSRLPPDEQHPLGHGRAAYFWALVASLGVFAVGSLLSVRQGITSLIHPEHTTHFVAAYVVLGISFALDSVSFVQAHGQLDEEARAMQRGFLEHLDATSDPISRAVFAEDASALVGNVVAFVGILLHQLTGSPVPEGIAAIVIGVLLGLVAYQLAARNADTLIGGQVSPVTRARVAEVIAAKRGVVRINELLVTFLGPRRVWVVARVAIDDALTGAEVQTLARETEAELMRDSPFVARVDLVPLAR